jgi:ribosome-associated heat shock protein Hsp15
MVVGTQAKVACDGGKVKIDGVAAKASFLLKPGQTIHFSNQGNKKIVKTLIMLEKRAGAEVAQACYEDLTPTELNPKTNPVFFYNFEVRDKGVGRPTKRQRRDIDRFKGDDAGG